VGGEGYDSRRRWRSGSDSVASRRSDRPAGHPFLPKPFSVQQLAAKVREVLSDAT